MKEYFFLARLIIGLWLTATTVSLCGCDKILEVKPPATQLSKGNVFASDASANAAMIGIYGTLSLSGFSSGDGTSVTYLAGLSSDEFYNYSTDASVSEFYKNNLSPSNLNIYTLWAGPYSTIYDCNAIIEGLNNNPLVSTGMKNELVGEALFLRSFSYFYLVNLFGDVPLIVSTNYSTNTNVERTPAEKVYDRIISDLLMSKDLMVADYSYSNGDKSRPNKYAAEFLLSRAYLFTGQYQLAEHYATEILSQTDKYKLNDSLSDVFYKNSTEAVWQLAPVLNTYPNESDQFILYAVPNSIALSKTLMNSFENNDLRVKKWIGTLNVSDTSYNFAYKYKNTYSNSVGVEYSMVFRLAELYLIRGEARLMQENLSGPNGALSDLNVIRLRAGLNPLSTGLTQNSILKEIQLQRQLELFSEWGHRWLDLKRYKSINGGAESLADEILPITKNVQWKSTARLYPIPQSQLDNDPKMKDQQNPGY